MENGSLSRGDKLKAIGLDPTLKKTQINDEVLNELYTKKQEGVKTEKQDKNKIEKAVKGSEKYELVLSFLNAVMKSINREEIKEITEFKNVKKSDLYNDACSKTLDEYIPKLVFVFSKNGIRYNSRKWVRLYILTVIKCVVQLCGYILKDSSVKENNNSKSHKTERETMYSVIEY
jgi:hypothetical protein